MYSTYGLVFAVLSNARTTLTDENTTSNGIGFLDVIKQNLRRNNDDYLDPIEGNQLSSSTNRSDLNTNSDLSRLGKGTLLEHNNSMMAAGNTYRRANGGQSWEFDYNDKKTRNLNISATKSNLTIDNLETVTKDSLRLRSNIKLTKYKSNFKRNISKLGLNEIQMINLKKSSMDPKQLKLARVPKLVKNKRFDKFKKFISENRQLLQLVNSKPKTQAEQIQLSQHHGKNDLKELKQNALRNHAAKVKAADDDRDTKLPDPQVLDMAPARGGRIHKLRVKGRLCFRHVLLPEGPKYDSRGRWYLPEHRLVAQYRYDGTPGPRLLLPRCCNCCKKSVLGCQ